MTDDDNREQHEPGEPEPQLLASGRAVSLAGILERIEAEFNAETGSRIDLFFQADEPTRRTMIREVADYVLAVESIKLTRADRLAVLEMLYRELFSFGPLEPYLSDPVISEIKITGHDRVYVRRGADDMISVNAVFSDALHLERSVQRALAWAGTRLTENDPFLEVGVLLAGRPARLTVTGAPISPVLHADIRLHSPRPATLESLADVLDDSAAGLLRAIIAAGHGLMIVGDVGTAKTSLLQALLPLLPAGSISVERARELRAPEGLRQRVAIPPAPDRAPVEFADQIVAALDEHPAWLVLDEVRFDESAALWSALTAANGPRCLWAFRGAIEPLRLRTAFGMAIRRAQASIGQAVIHSALLDRLPFVALLARHNRQLKLVSIGEWQRGPPDNIVLRRLWPVQESRPFHAVDWSPGER
jgi:type IV secretory pathway ATPase VirB11/archaellum biosynthesis ATPase